MAAPTRRASKAPVRRDPDDRRAIAALDEEFSVAGPAVRIGELLSEQDAVYRPKRELDANAQRLATRFARDSNAIAKRVSIETEARHTRWGPMFDVGQIVPPARDLLHVYGPDVDKTGGQWFYTMAWTNFDDIPGAGVGANVDLQKGTFYGSAYTTGPQHNTYAGLGMRLTPALKWCTLSVRPYVEWSGFDILKTRVFDDSVDETRWASALGQVGIIVQSWDASGNGYYRDARFFLNMFLRSEPNPSEWLDFDGVIGSIAGLSVDVLASSDRHYAIWVCSRAWVAADPGFAKATMASSSMNCHVPFVVVEEQPF